MSDTLFLEEFPDEWIVNLSQTDIGAANSNCRPGKRPADGVEPINQQLVWV